MSEDRVRVVIPVRVRATTSFRKGQHSSITHVPMLKRKARLLWFFPDPNDLNTRVVIIVPTNVDAGRVEGSKGRKFFIEGPKDVVRNVLLQLSSLGVDVSDALKVLEPPPKLCEYVCPDGSRGKAPCGMADMEPYTIEGTGWSVTRHYDPDGEFVEAWDNEITRDIKAGIAEPYELHEDFIKHWGVKEYRAAKYNYKDKVVIRLWFKYMYKDPYSGLEWPEWEEQEWVRKK